LADAAAGHRLALVALRLTAGSPTSVAFVPCQRREHPPKRPAPVRSVGL